jgi:hypothetical protein
MATVNIPTGYRLLGVIPFPKYNDRWLVTFGFGKDFGNTQSTCDIYYVAENKYTQSITNWLIGVVVYVKEDYYINHLVT